MDSYQKFLNHFGIDKMALFEWGIEATIFPPIEKVILEWESLKTRVLTDQQVCIRGYGRNGHGTQLYIGLYKFLFGNSHVEEDPTNNYAPQKCIQRLTGLKRNKDIYNYQISHIWGHTKKCFFLRLRGISAIPQKSWIRLQDTKPKAAGQKNIRRFFWIGQRSYINHL